MAKQIKLGTKIKDRITGLEGIAIAKIEYLNGCVQYSIKPKLDKDGKVQEGEWVDSQQIAVVGEKVLEVKKASGGTGGASNIAPRL